MRRKRNEQPDQATPPSAPPPEEIPAEDVMLAETVARHFEGATTAGRIAHLGDLGVEIECRVFSIQQMGRQYVAVLHLWIGGGLVEPPVFASISGYHETPHGAVVEGGCQWACSFGPVLETALTDCTPPEHVSELEATIGATRYRVVLSGLDRTMATTGGTPGATVAARERLAGGSWLSSVVIDSATLPVLPPGRSLLSVFVGATHAGTTTEVKVNGGDWQPSNTCFSRDLSPTDGPVTLMREFAVLTPLEWPAPLSRDAVQSTLTGIALSSTGPSSAAGWLGWATHGGRLGETLKEATLTNIERRTGPLPTDYRRFLADVGGPGAGPGYGLLVPARTDDFVVLARAGCGVTWKLRLDPAHHGTIWVDAAGSDERFEQVAGSFDEWYRNWLNASVRDGGPWIQWNARHCATVGVISQILNEKEARGESTENLGSEMGPGSIALTFNDGSGPRTIDPCHSCVTLAARFGISADAFAPGLYRAT